MVGKAGSLAASRDTEQSPERPARTRAEIGKANSTKGKNDERRVAHYLRFNGFPDAKRTVRAGFRAAGYVSRDEGDICGTPGIAWQIKSTDERRWYQIPQWLSEASEQKMAAGAFVGILVLKRRGYADPSSWWAWLWLNELAALLPGRGGPRSQLVNVPHVPVRLQLGDVLPILHHAGYGKASA